MKALIFLIAILTGCGTVAHQKVKPVHQKSAFTSETSIYEMFGDSIFATSNHRVASEFVRMTGHRVNDHSKTGAWMWQIVEQYKQTRDNDVHRIIMDGGGNDVLGNSSACKNMTDQCKTVIHDALVKLNQAMNMMGEDGLTEFIFMGVHYPRKSNNGYDNAVNYAWGFLKDICRDRPYKCTLVDPRGLLLDEKLLEWDGVHPNWNGTSALAGLIREGL